MSNGSLTVKSILNFCDFNVHSIWSLLEHAKCFSTSQENDCEIHISKIFLKISSEVECLLRKSDFLHSFSKIYRL